MTQGQKQSLTFWTSIIVLALTGGAWSGRLESKTSDIKTTQEVHSQAIKQLLENSTDESRKLRDEIGELKIQNARIEQQLIGIKEQIVKP